MATDRYIETIGRRKTATARVRITEASKNSLTVNGVDGLAYFLIPEYVTIASEALKTEDLTSHFSVSAKVSGGGRRAQADAVRLGIARGLTTFKGDLRPALKKAGFLKRDPRAKERKKPGLKKARKSAQWSKR